MKPTREQIEAWWEEAFSTLTWTDEHHAYLAEKAYTAGRKAGMEEAARLCEAIAGRHEGAKRKSAEWSAGECADAIRAAMEADK